MRNLDGSAFHVFGPATMKVLDMSGKRSRNNGVAMGCKVETTVSATLAEFQHVRRCSTAVDIKHQHT